MVGIRLLLQVSGLYFFYIIGNGIQHTFKLPIPGSIIGMLILFLLLLTKIIKTKWIELGSTFLIRWLPLLFLPSVVGIDTFGSFFMTKGKWLVLLVIFNTMIVMAFGAWTSQWLAIRNTRKKGDNSLC